MIPVLPVSEIIRAQVRSGKDDFIIASIELYMLQTPALVDPLWDQPLFKSFQIWCMVHSHLDLVGKLLDEIGKHTCAAWFGAFSSTSERICKNANFELRSIGGECLSDCRDQFVLRLANIECREVYTLFGRQNLSFEGRVEVGGCRENLEFRS